MTISVLKFKWTLTPLFIFKFLSHPQTFLLLTHFLLSLSDSFIHLPLLDLSSHSLWLPHPPPLSDLSLTLLSLSSLLWSLWRRHGVGKWCLWVLVWIGVGSCGLWAMPCYGLAVVHGYWYGLASTFGLFVGWQWKSGFWFGLVVGRWWRFVDFGLDRRGGFALV